VKVICSLGGVCVLFTSRLYLASIGYVTRASPFI